MRLLNLLKLPRRHPVITGVVLAIFGAVFAFWFVTRDPSPESEVRKFFAQKDLSGVVAVRDCGYVDHDSVTDLYWCRLVATRRIVIPHIPHNLDVPAGPILYCFIIPRADQQLGFDENMDAVPAGVIARRKDC